MQSRDLDILRECGHPTQYLSHYVKCLSQIYGLWDLTMTWIRHNCVTPKSFTALIPLTICIAFLPSSWTNCHHASFSSLPIWPFLECHMVRIIQDITFSDCLLSINSIYLRFFRMFFGFIAHSWILFVCSFTCRRMLGCFQFFAFTHRASINILIQVLSWQKFSAHFGKWV